MSPRERIVPLFVPHLGCRHACVFCDQRRRSGQRVPVGPQDVVNALRAAAAADPDGAGRQLAFYGGSFTAIPPEQQQQLLAAAQPFLADGTISSIRVSTRPDAIDNQTLTRLLHAGVRTVELGAQSMQERVLTLSGRGHTRQDTQRAAQLVRAAGLGLVLQMMTGLPGADEAGDVETARQLAALRPDGVRIYPTVVLADTPLYRLWRDGAYRAHTVEDAVRVCARIVPIFEAQGIAILRIGLNPTAELSGGGAVAGAYHPALGELVRARIWLGRAQALLSEAGVCGGSVTLGVHPSCISQLTGQHRQNITALTQQYGLRALHVRAAACAPGELMLLARGA